MCNVFYTLKLIKVRFRYAILDRIIRSRITTSKRFVKQIGLICLVSEFSGMNSVIADIFIAFSPVQFVLPPSGQRLTCTQEP
jgi:hypothetical protein